MRNFFYILCFLSLFFSFDILATSRIAILDVSNVFQKLPQHASIAKRLQNEFKGRLNILQTLEHTLRSKIENFKRDALTMKVRDRVRIEKDIMDQHTVFLTKAQAFETDNRRRQMEERNKLLKHVQDVLRKFASDQGYEVILDSNAVIYHSLNVKEVSKEILKRMK